MPELGFERTAVQAAAACMLPRVKTRAIFLAALFVAAAVACGASTEPAVAPTPPPTAAQASPAPPSPPPATSDAPPKLRLPDDTRPTAETLELHIDPKQDRFSGVVDIAITLDQPRAVVWLHGLHMNATRASATPEGGAAIAATWKQEDDTGLA